MRMLRGQCEKEEERELGRVGGVERSALGLARHCLWYRGAEYRLGGSDWVWSKIRVINVTTYTDRSRGGAVCERFEHP